MEDQEDQEDAEEIEMILVISREMENDNIEEKRRAGVLAEQYLYDVKFHILSIKYQALTKQFFRTWATPSRDPSTPFCSNKISITNTRLIRA